MIDASERAVLSGNEAIARGAWEAGCRFAAAYPGTPSTEILENCGTYAEIDAQWGVNEKTAMETAIGASYGGARSLCAQKHVGLNVAADPFFTVAYTGVNGGLVLITADDPGMHSSQNEQDNRHYARMAKLPMFEPSSAQEAKDMTIAAFEMSEQFDTPVLMRITTRVAHSEGVVTLGTRREVTRPGFTRQAEKYCVLPQNARVLHQKIEQRFAALEQFGATSTHNRIEAATSKSGKKLGIITSGIAYAYAREIFPDAAYLKLGLSYPLPRDLVKKFAATCDTLVVIEENDPFLEDQIRVLGINVIGKDRLPICGELNPDIVRESLAALAAPETAITPPALVAEAGTVPLRPPVLCPGCPHRGVFFLLRKLNLTVTGDIGCYSLGALPPHNAIHTLVCMGASITVAMGLEKAMGKEIQGKVVAVLGESTFIHSGITGLIDMVYNGGTALTMILDNSITAMTGHQPNPAMGKTLKGETTTKLDLPTLVRATGVSAVHEIDPFDLTTLEAKIKECLAAGKPTVIIAQRPCALLKGIKTETRKVGIDRSKCVKCGQCWKLGCPAIEVDPADGKTRLNAILCVHCGLCARVCRPKAITQEGGQV